MYNGKICTCVIHCQQKSSIQILNFSALIFVNLECINIFVMELEGPHEGRLSSTVPWEHRGETPLREPIMPNAKLNDFLFL